MDAWLDDTRRQSHVYACHECLDGWSVFVTTRGDVGPLQGYRQPSDSTEPQGAQDGVAGHGRNASGPQQREDGEP